MRHHLTSQSLRSRILRAGFWTFFGHISSQAVRLGSNLIMTRLLVPEMFGVMAIANLVLFGLALFSDVGIGQGIVQSRRGHDPVYLNTSWTVQIIRGIVIWLLALTLALVIYFINLMK